MELFKRKWIFMDYAVCTMISVLFTMISGFYLHFSIFSKAEIHNWSYPHEFLLFILAASLVIDLFAFWGSTSKRFEHFLLVAVGLGLLIMCKVICFFLTVYQDNDTENKYDHQSAMKAIQMFCLSAVYDACRFVFTKNIIELILEESELHLSLDGGPIEVELQEFPPPRHPNLSSSAYRQRNSNTSNVQELAEKLENELDF